MMQNAKRHVGKGRPNTSGRNVRSRPQMDKQVANDGVFANRRFTHATTALVGCVVQVQVKNKSIYEGIFKTFNSKMDVVLEVVHKVEDNNNSRNMLSSVPSRDRLLDIMIFNTSDILSLTALNVDMDYAVKDNFTDSAIVGKVNGQMNEQDMKELQPWESDGGTELSLDGGETSSQNGWDPDDMFRRNREQFNVQSSYDASLQLYTTPLEKKDTKEFRRREEEAEKLATEIEKSDIYKQRIELENGDGDEEKLYSAVVRPNEPSSQVQGSLVKNQRVRHAGRSRGGGHPGQNLPNRPQRTSQSPTQSVQLPTDEARLNGDKHDIKEDKRPETLSPLSNKTSPVPEHRPAIVSPDSKPELSPSSPTTTVNSKVDRKNSAPRARDAQIQELKEFSSNFKLTDEKEKDVEKEENEKQSQSNIELEQQQEKMAEKTEEEAENSAEVSPKIKQSTLNPMAKEFVPNPLPKAKPPQPSQQQIATPPRPRTQSPIIQSMQMQNQIFPYHIMPQTVVSMPAPAPTSQQQYRQPKRAVVSVPRDYTAAPAVVQAATGQPLLAGPHSQYTVSYLPQHNFQVMPMPAVNPQGQRMPNQGNVHMVPTSHHASDQAGPPHPTQMFMTLAGPGPVPAHINPHPTQPLSHGHPTPAHIGPPQVAAQQQQNQQHSQMAHQSVGHPAPSPVQHSGPQTQIHHGQAHPPSSGTPQPQGYNPQIGQQGHPPLQPSPHNPTSPQGIPHHMSMPYQLTNHGHVQGANPQFTVQQTHQPTSVSHTMQSQGQNPHIHQPQLVMMPQPHHQVQHAHLQQQPQFQGHPMSGPAPMPGQSHVIPQTGLQAVLHNSNPNSVHHPSQNYYVPQVPNQAPQVQAYQQGQ